VIEADQKIAPSCDLFALATTTPPAKVSRPATRPSKEKQSIPHPVSAQVAPIPNASKPKTIAANEIVVAKLPVDADAYTYSLVDDGDGFFILRGNELRCDRQRLQAQGGIKKTLTVCRTDAQGNSVHRSFKVELQPNRQPGRVA
jgi:hypothetical protein